MIGVGQTIGNYRIVSKIGTGGMGAVFLAEHPSIGKKVALKVIHRELSGNKDVVGRFFQEARAANAIGNEHIVEIHDFGVTPEGDHFYIMEYLEGRTLASILTHETVLHPLRVLHIGAQMATALGAAHGAGVLHRDLKPDNIMLMARLGDPDFVKVLDFGLAKMFDGAGAADAVKTAAGVLLGTPQYMSPEACETKHKLDHRTDVYAVGILLFQMSTGVLPFDGESMGEVLVKQVREMPPAPRGINPNIPPAVEQVILRCLAKSPDARFQTMAELREALVDPEQYIRASPPMSPARSIVPGDVGLDAAKLLKMAEAAHRAHVDATGGGRNPIPGLAGPATPQMHTMRIGTPHGYVSRPPRRIWPIVIVVGLLLGLGGGAVAVALMRRSPAATSPSPVSSVANVGSGSAVVEMAVTQAAPDAAIAIDAPPVVVDAAPIEVDAAPVVMDAAGPIDAPAAVIDASPPPPIVVDAAPLIAAPPPDAPKKKPHPKKPVDPTVKPPPHTGSNDSSLMTPE